MVRKDGVNMSCPICGGRLKYSDGLFICESCGSKQTLTNYYENIEVFICYVENDEQGRRTRDSVIAQDLYTKLEAAGISTFYQRISTADLTGDSFEKGCMEAMGKAEILLVFGTTAGYFKQLLEQERSNLSNKRIIPVYSGMNAYDIPKELGNLQAMDYGSIGAATDLIKNILYILGRENEIDIVKIADEKAKRKKLITIFSVCTILIALLVAGSYVIFETPYVLKSKKYDYAEKLTNTGNYLEAIKILSTLQDYTNSSNLLKSIYDKYDGYYVQNGLSLYFNVDNNSNCEIEITHTVNDMRTTLNTSAVINGDTVGFVFKDSQHNQGEGYIELHNDSINLSLNIDENSEQINMSFNISDKSDIPLTSGIDNDTLVNWLLQPKKESDFINERYDLIFYEKIFKSSESIKRIDNTDVYLAIFNNIYAGKNGVLLEFSHVDDGYVLALLAPASIVCPEYIGMEAKPIKTNDILYFPEADFINPNGEVSFSNGGSELTSITRNSKHENYISENTLIAATSKYWVSERNWNNLLGLFM